MWKRRGRWAVLVTVLVAWAGLSHAGEIDYYEGLQKYVKDEGRECIRRDELIAYLLNDKDSLLEAVRDQKCPPEKLKRLAEHRADGIIAMAWANPIQNEPACAKDCPDCVSLDRASQFLKQLAASGVAARGCQTEPAPQKEESFWTKVWSNLTLKRGLTDSFDPRKTKLPLPAVVSYLYDEEASAQRYQTTIIGAVAYRFLEQGKRNVLTAALGLDADVEPTKAASSDVVDAGLNLSYQWVSQTPTKSFFESVLLSATPKATTDSAFQSRVYEASLTALPTSGPLWIGKPIPKLPVGLQFEPTAGLEFGRVVDAGHNQKLAAIQAAGAYTRLLAQVRAKVWAPTWDRRLGLTATYTLRYDVSERWTRHFFEALLGQDLDDKGTFSATLAYRCGRKPPDFAGTGQLLFGIGVKK